MTESHSLDLKDSAVKSDLQQMATLYILRDQVGNLRGKIHL